MYLKPNLKQDLNYLVHKELQFQLKLMHLSLIQQEKIVSDTKHPNLGTFLLQMQALDLLAYSARYVMLL